jgi:hypothetical protein
MEGYVLVEVDDAVQGGLTKEGNKTATDSYMLGLSEKRVTE